MLNPKRFIPPPKQKGQSGRPVRRPPFLAARRFIGRGFRTTRRHIESLQLRGLTCVQHLLEVVFPQEVLFPAELLALADQASIRVTSVLGALISGGTHTQATSIADNYGKEEKFLVYEIRIVGVDGDLKEIAEKALTIRPNFSYTLTEVNEDLDKVLQTGYFQSKIPFGAKLIKNHS